MFLITWWTNSKKSTFLLHSSRKVDVRNCRSFLLTRSFMELFMLFNHPIHYYLCTHYIKSESALIPIYSRFSRVSPWLVKKKQHKNTNFSDFFQVSSFRRLPNLLQLLEKLPEEKWLRKDKAPEDAFQAESLTGFSKANVYGELTVSSWRMEGLGFLGLDS